MCVVGWLGCRFLLTQSTLTHRLNLFIYHWLLIKIKDSERRHFQDKDFRADTHRNGPYVILTSNCRNIYLTSDTTSPSWNSKMCKYYSSASYQHSWSQGGGALNMNKSHTFVIKRKFDKLSQLSAPCCCGYLPCPINQSINQKQFIIQRPFTPSLGRRQHYAIVWSFPCASRQKGPPSVGRGAGSYLTPVFLKNEVYHCVYL